MRLGLMASLSSPLEMDVRESLGRVNASPRHWAAQEADLVSRSSGLPPYIFIVHDQKLQPDLKVIPISNILRRGTLST